MKRIFTLFLTSVVLLLSKTAISQPNTASSSISMTTSATLDPAIPISGPAFSSPQQSPIGTFTSTATVSPTTLETPYFHINMNTSSVTFAITLATASGTSDIDAYSLKLEYGVGGVYDAGEITNLPTPVTTTPTPYYFTINISPDLPANTNFRFVLTMNVPAPGSDIIASSFRIQSGFVVLPVNFKSIAAKKFGKDAQVIWEVGDENNVDHYDIERSTNGRDFVKVGQVAATNSPVYNFIDNHPYSGVSFYRIKNVDIDGKSKYSVIARLNLNAIIALQAYPQPASSSLTVEHGNAVNGNLHLFTVGGQVVKTIKVSPDRNQTPVDISSLNKGLYMLRFDNGQGSIETIKIVKQ